DIDDAELDLWRDVSHRLFVPFLPDGVISQFEGYEQLEEFDWSAYKTKHSDIGRLDRILGAEGDAPNRYRLSKQPDVLMLLYLFPIDEVQRLLAVLGYEADKAALLRTVEFYAARTSHGSTLSRVVHAWLLARSDPSASWSLFLEALESDLYDIQGGTTPEGIHLGIMAGTVDLVRRGFAGVEPVEGGVLVDPRLPPQLASVRYSLLVRECWLDVDLTNGQLTLSNRSGNEADVRVKLRDQETVLSPGRSMKVPS
ncbi:MAG: glycosyl hydrolase family 65 protein, partial [Halobacteriota archaeon]